MSAGPTLPLTLGPDERLVGRWNVEMITQVHPNGETGCLVLTTYRCLFFRQGGLFAGRKLEAPPAFSLMLERIQSVSNRASSMEIGYGDHVSVPGLEVNGQEFRLGRGVVSDTVVAEIAHARAARDRPPGASPSE
jgi:hypothetical protein